MVSKVTWQGQLLDALLEQRFSISTGFHPGQRDIIEHLIQGKRVLAIQRTGWGKSLCYQMASLFHPHLTLVFSPLKALMRDQCQRCNKVYAIPSAIVSSDFSDDENRNVLEQAIVGDDLIRATGLSQKAITSILTDLEEQCFIQRHPRDRTYRASGRLAKMHLSDYDAVRTQKLHELEAMQNYAHHAGCYMGYLTEYLGDPAGYRCGVCGHCQQSHFPPVTLSERIPEIVTLFLEKEFLPRIEKRGTEKYPIHEAGWSLSYHGNSHIGKSVRASKYEGAGSFTQELVSRAVEVIQTRYPIEAIDGIVSVPPTKSGVLVEVFARQVADLLRKEYFPVLTKARTTQEQKKLTNHVQKADNVKGAFSVTFPLQIAGCTLLLIDDIYDSGYMLREVAQTLMRAGAKVIYPFTITRTIHSDDQ